MEGSDRYIPVSINWPCLKLVDIDTITGVVVFRQLSFEPLGSYLNVILPSCQDMVSHGLDPLRTIPLQRSGTTDNPRRKNKIRVADGVIRVQVGDECSFEVRNRQPRDPFPKRRAGAPHDS